MGEEKKKEEKGRKRGKREKRKGERGDFTAQNRILNTTMMKIVSY